MMETREEIQKRIRGHEKGAERLRKQIEAIPLAQYTDGSVGLLEPEKGRALGVQLGNAKAGVLDAMADLEHFDARQYSEAGNPERAERRDSLVQQIAELQRELDALDDAEHDRGIKEGQHINRETEFRHQAKVARANARGPA